jgi:hypothetical protein
LIRQGYEVIGLDTGLYKERTFYRDSGTTPLTLAKDLRCIQSKISRVWTPSSTWPNCPMIRLGSWLPAVPIQITAGVGIGYDDHVTELPDCKPQVPEKSSKDRRSRRLSISGGITA